MRVFAIFSDDFKKPGDHPAKRYRAEKASLPPYIWARHRAKSLAKTFAEGGDRIIGEDGGVAPTKTCVRSGWGGRHAKCRRHTAEVQGRRFHLDHHVR